MFTAFVSAVSAVVLKGLKGLGDYLVRRLAVEIAKRMPERCRKEKPGTPAK